jgi:hypothetical protein
LVLLLNNIETALNPDYRDVTRTHATTQNGSGVATWKENCECPL